MRAGQDTNGPGMLAAPLPPSFVPVEVHALADPANVFEAMRFPLPCADEQMPTIFRKNHDGALRCATAMKLAWHRLAWPVAALAGMAISAEAMAVPETIVVTGSRIETPAIDAPAAVDAISGDAVRLHRPQVGIGEALGTIAGVQARERQNFAQDVQISIRGFGARSTFGIRGVRVIVDGIPATLPDGQGQLSHIDLGSVGRIEVLRGPYSALYGNASGGVVQVFTEDGGGPLVATADVGAGSDDLRRAAIRLRAGDGAFGITASASRFATDGYRRHGAAERVLGNVKFAWAPRGGATRLGVVVNHVALPSAQDPLGLTRAQFDADPRGVDTAALAFDTRKSMRQTQAGITLDQRLGSAGRLQGVVYAGRRTTEQFQSIPVAVQAAPRHPGGVIELARDYRGADWRWLLTPADTGVPLSLVLGVAHDGLDEHRRGRENFAGAALGVAGALRRDEINRVDATDVYAQLETRPMSTLTLSAGVRSSRVRFRSADRYVTPANPDDSGSVEHAATLPVLGIVWAASPALRVYASAGRGFETPTVNELSYPAAGQSGLNLALGPARSDSVEVGVKLRRMPWGEGRIAVFRTATDDEIVTLANVGGRSTFTNAGATRRHGVEATWSAPFGAHGQATLGAATLDARYRDGFATCAAVPCVQPTLWIAAGHRIPGISRRSGHASLSWAPPHGWTATAELRGWSRIFVNDANSDAAGGAMVLGLSLGYAMRTAFGDAAAFVRVDNATDRRHAGSVIVNEGNRRFFEPAPGRTWLAGATLTFGR